jgi:hypothetical protein
MGKQILREGYASLFHGRMRILGETVEITYEFSDSRELEDFTPVENGGDVRLAAEDGEFVLQGECRFLRGEPFQDRLEVRLEVSSFPLEAPNINIGLWTKEGDVLGLVLRRGAEDALPAEAFGAAPLTNLRASCILFGLGYAPVDPLTASLGCAGPDQRLLFPCRAILTCSRAGDLRRPSSWRCQWGENLSTLKPMRPPQHVLAAHGPGGLEWSTGGWKLDAADSLRVLESMDAGVRKGSLTLFTNGGVLRCKSLAIVGALAPEWLDTQAEERARRNLGSMLPELDWEEEGR